MLRIGVRTGAVAVVALLAALVLGWPRLVALSLVLLGGAYALYLAVRNATRCRPSAERAFADSGSSQHSAPAHWSRAAAYWPLPTSRARVVSRSTFSGRLQPP